MVKKIKKTRAGIRVKNYNRGDIGNLENLEKSNGKLLEVRNYSGRYGGFFKNGQFRFIRFTNNNTEAKVQKGGNKKTINLKKAVKLLRNYYSEKYN
tara:strand:+ start:423 stop:710 length:288 start_codon:yes stop_codon:yes gene_type:complete